MILDEVFMANGIAVIMMLFLLHCRHHNRESIHIDDKVYDIMVIFTILGAMVETLSFIIEGRLFPGARVLSYVLNSFCFITTSGISFLWCAYVDLHIYKNQARSRHHIRLISLPFLFICCATLYNAFGTGFLFRITAENVYQRAGFCALSYLSVFFYFVYSVYLVKQSKEEGINLDFFPIFYFVGPCAIAMPIQFLHYGITTVWISVALSLTFVQMQEFSENISTDTLSGLYNRHYLEGILSQKALAEHGSLYGIMIDINDFKRINDHYGHHMGDEAIRDFGSILSKSMPETGIPIRYAGDEFVVLLRDKNEDAADELMDEINRRIHAFNLSGTEPFTLSVSMGEAKLDPMAPESFLQEMDARMYEEKRRYHDQTIHSDEA